MPFTPKERDTGAAAIEFAILLPVLILVVFGTIQFGIAYNRVQGLQAAAREGARLASIDASVAQIRDRVRGAQSLFDPGDVTVQVRVASGPNNGQVVTSGGSCAAAGIGELIRVTASVAPDPDYGVTIPLMGTTTFTYSATGTFRCEKIQF